MTEGRERRSTNYLLALSKFSDANGVLHKNGGYRDPTTKKAARQQPKYRAHKNENLNESARGEAD